MIQPALPRLRALYALAVLLFPLAFAVAVAAPVFPELTGRVVDEAGILSATTRQELTQMLAAHERESGEQIVVVTLKSLQGYDIADYGYQLGRHWGIGEKGKNTGVLLIVAPNERKVRIEVGYGLEGVLTDAESRVIIEHTILPEFRSGDFNAGVRDGTAEILRALGGKAEAAPIEARPAAAGGGAGTIIFFLIVIAWMILWRYLLPFAMSAWLPGPWPGGRYSRRGGIWFGGSSGGFSGGGFSGGGFSGGGFSGGGGSFGGGGASGSW